MLKWAFEYKSPKLDEATHTQKSTQWPCSPPPFVSLKCCMERMRRKKRKRTLDTFIVKLKCFRNLKKCRFLRFFLSLSRVAKVSVIVSKVNSRYPTFKSRHIFTLEFVLFTRSDNQTQKKWHQTALQLKNLVTESVHYYWHLTGNRLADRAIDVNVIRVQCLI